MSREDVQEMFDRELQEKGVRLKDRDQLKVRQDVFDEVTLLALYRFVHKRLISAIGGAISTGKEANVFYGEMDGRPLAIKIYLVQTANFRRMTEYLDGDPRFARIRRTRKDIIFAWTRKEYSNLARAREAGVRVPEPIAFDRNILLMEFLGEDELAYPPIRLAEVNDPPAVYEEVVDSMRRLFQEARLVHADLSEFNILYDGRVPYIIDLSQAVTLDHPRAIPFLVRDIHNVNRFFSQLLDVPEEKEVFKRITGNPISGLYSERQQEGSR
ncbi:MAG: serine protein kinase RIO [Methanomicrobiales archaeon]|nr:serine protein kinase RIO [Methanomicrobiales archaeon]MDI6876003.1 serine protein kinase RIO [Methanomicrobiales archaeon]